MEPGSLLLLLETSVRSLRVCKRWFFSQVPVSDLGECHHICHFFRWQKMRRVTFVTFLGRMWRCRTRKYFLKLWRFLAHPPRKTSQFGPAGTRINRTWRNVTIRLGLKHVFLFPSQAASIYAGNKMDFTRGNFKPKSASSILQSLSCRFVDCNCVIEVNPWSPKVKTPPQESRVCHLSGAGMSSTLLHQFFRS